jgi:molecular chaperone GrpE
MTDEQHTNLESSSEATAGGNPSATTEPADVPQSESIVSDAPSTPEETPSVFDALELESEPNADIQTNLAAEVESLQRKLDGLQAQFDQRNDQYKRMTADFENFRKRTEREKEELTQSVRAAAILEILPVLDTFGRAKDQLNPESEEAQKVHNSYQGVFKQFLECLKRLGVVPMDCEGKEFDPTFHNAIMREPTDQYTEGTIIQQFQSGYMMGERVLRHAVVKVAAALDTSGESTEG